MMWSYLQHEWLGQTKDTEVERFMIPLCHQIVEYEWLC